MAAMAEATKAADDLGYHSINLPEHIILPYKPTDPAIADETWYDNFVLAAHLATITNRIRFTFFTLIVPYRPPIQTAKQLATLDVLSEGRVTLGTGVGWMEGEFDLLGVPFEKRGAITDEYLQAFRVLWTDDHPAFQGEFVSFADARFEPKPVQKPHIPIWIGGMGPAARRRAVQYGAGWMPLGSGRPGSNEFLDAASEVNLIKEMLTTAGRDPDDFRFAFSLSIGEQRAYTPHPTAATHDRMGRPASRGDAAHPATEPEPLGFDAPKIIDDVGKMREAGFNHIYARLGFTTPAELIKNMEWFAAKVMPAFE
jgi:probable F420-dependent oxidoreductase